MNYILTGFSQDAGFRVFGFEGVGDDPTRPGYLVRADLALIRKYGIRVQDLPLLCRGILERRDTTVDQRTFTYAEADMRSHQNVVATRAAASAPRRTGMFGLNGSAKTAAART